MLASSSDSSWTPGDSLDLRCVSFRGCERRSHPLLSLLLVLLVAEETELLEHHEAHEPVEAGLRSLVAVATTSEEGGEGLDLLLERAGVLGGLHHLGTVDTLVVEELELEAELFEQAVCDQGGVGGDDFVLQLDLAEHVVRGLVRPEGLEQGGDDLVDHALPALGRAAVAGELLHRRRVHLAVLELRLDAHLDDDEVGAALGAGDLELDGEGVSLLHHQYHGVAQEARAEDRVTDLQHGAPLVGARQGAASDVPQSLAEADLALTLRQLDEGVRGDVHPLGRRGLGEDCPAEEQDGHDQHRPLPPGEVPPEVDGADDEGEEGQDLDDHPPLHLVVVAAVVVVAAAVPTVAGVGVGVVLIFTSKHLGVSWLSHVVLPPLG